MSSKGDEPNSDVVSRRSAGRRRALDELVAEMHREYMKPRSLAEVGRRFNRKGTTVRELFRCRGLTIRKSASAAKARQEGGRFSKRAPLTEADVENVIAGMQRFNIPAAIKRDWRSWSLERRIRFVEKLRARISPKNQRPSGRFSANVEPFDYTTVKAHEIASRALREGRKNPPLKIGCQGVIWNDRLWFWAPRVGYCGSAGGGSDRKALHHAIWEKAHKPKKIPSGHVVRFRDGNTNNLDPANLALAPRDALALENRRRRRTG